MELTSSATSEKLTNRALTVGKSIASLVVLLIVWEIVTQLGLIHRQFLPPVSNISMTFYDLTVSGEMIHHTQLTVRRALAGLAISAVVGVAVGVSCSHSAIVNWFWDPILKIGYPAPEISFIPVFMLWFGFGDMSKIILVAVGCFWPVAVNAREATRNINERYLWSARMMGTSGPGLIWKVTLPAASPGILTGLQIALPIALIITFIFEMLAGGGGLGHLQIQGVRRFKPTRVYAAIFAIMIVGLVLDRLLRYVRGRVLSWE